MTSIQLSRSALNSLIVEAAASADGMETGGILLGYASANEIVVSAAGGPGPRARRTAVTFDRDLAHAQELADAAWARDQSQWIGEWHTHPNGALVPSPRDVASYMAHLRDVNLAFDRFICVISGAPNDGSLPVSGWIISPLGVHRASVQVVRDPKEESHA